MSRSERRIAELERNIEWLEERLSVVSQALDAAVRREMGLPEDASAERLADAMVEAMSAGFRRLEEGYAPPDGLADLLETKLVQVVVERHACGGCEHCKAREAVREKLQ